MSKRFTLFSTSILVTFLSVSASASWFDNHVSREELSELSRHPVWHKLLHYERTGLIAGRTGSAIHSSDFFTASNGATDPRAELAGTLEAFAQTVSEDPDDHAQCRFRGRYFWLRGKLDFLETALPKVACPAYEKWSLKGETESLSVVFATGYLGNPASYYGHILLKLNAEAHDYNTQLEDITVNYGAIVPRGEGPISYILKGALGGYDAGFSHIQYYFHNHNYGENELRDLWEYELNLSRDEVELILGHTWEVLGKKYTYYFANKNCAFRLAELLELLDGVEIIPENPFWIMPQRLIQKMSQAQRGGRGLVKNVRYHPSRQSRLYEKFYSLNREQKKLVSDIAADINLLDSEWFFNLGITDKQLVLDTLLDYFQYVRDAALLDEDINNHNYRKVLMKRFRLPPGENEFEPVLKSGPHNGRKPSLLSAGIVYNQEFGHGSRVVIRPAYYDALDAGPGHVENASLSMLKVHLVGFSDTWRLRNLEVVSIESSNTNVTGLPGDTSRDWKLGFGLEQQSVACNNCLVPLLSGGVGRSRRINDHLFIGGYLGSNVQQAKNGLGSLLARANAVANITIGQNMRARLVSEYREYLDGKSFGYFVNGVQLRYEIIPDFDVRLTYEKNVAEEYGLSFSLYW